MSEQSLSHSAWDQKIKSFTLASSCCKIIWESLTFSYPQGKVDPCSISVGLKESLMVMSSCSSGCPVSADTDGESLSALQTQVCWTGKASEGSQRAGLQVISVSVVVPQRLSNYNHNCHAVLLFIRQLSELKRENTVLKKQLSELKRETAELKKPLSQRRVNENIHAA